MPPYALLQPLLAFLLALAVAATAPALAQSRPQAQAITLTPIKVSRHGWYFRGDTRGADTANRGFMSNAGFVVTREGVVVYDALGTPALGTAMIKAIRQVTRAPIKRVIVSHYHADHVYGLQPFKTVGAEIWGHEAGEQYFATGQAQARLAQRRIELAPWVDATTEVLKPDLWLAGDTDFRLGGLTFRIIHARSAHTPEDVMLFVDEDRLLFAGDLLFSGRVPFVGNADSKGWLAAMDRIVALAPAVAVPGHGDASRDVARDLALTRDYLVFLRDAMGKAVAEMQSFDEAYAKTDWSRFAALPAFAQANRINAYGTYLRLEQEALGGARP